MNTVRTAPLPPVARTRPVVEAAGLVLVAGLFALVFWLVRPPPHVARVEIVNRSDTPIEVAVASSGGGDELGLAEALPGVTTRVHDVVDQGDRWVFRLSTAGCPVVEVPVSRARLEAADWRFTVPTQVAGTLAAGCRYEPPVR